MVPQALRTVAVKATSRIGRPVIVNSYGRSGSTVLFMAIRNSASKPVLRVAPPSRDYGAQAWRLEGLRVGSGRVYKSHDRPPTRMPRGARMLYVFGDPVASTLSVIKRGSDSAEWMALHCEHLGVPRCAPEDLIGRDALRIEEHLRSWLDGELGPIAFVRYEALWEHADRISDFAGLPVTLPQRRERSTSVDQAPPALLETYAPMRELVASLPDWQVRP
ncbi:hypothetical protein [Demequina activiva]|uniref:Sulfotransferase n=1 Tax=Demequina activiva TaxID=1582364 RepID=A0A919UFT2_9MICO|nr:hypothetical protein [Demequina activiva]GIG53769.1 hypothetical protein Dac01nite_05210 [Demequina activiva]